MPMTRSSVATSKSAEAEHVELGSDEMEETLEEEVEYEEVEEEVEEEEEEDPDELDEEEIEEEEEEEDGPHSRIARKESDDGNDAMKSAEADDELGKKHAELLALPPHGSQVYFGGISPVATEDDLKRFCESIGEVTEVKIMKGKGAKENKGYGFVTFRTNELASKAIKELNGSELKGERLKCSLSQAKNKLFIGNIPRNWGEMDLKKVVDSVGPGVIVVELLKDPKNSGRNRGFAFVEYFNNACADYSREKMSALNFKLDDNAPTVSWADPKNADSSTSQIKAIYVKNLPKDVTQDQLQDLFEHHGKITKVVLPSAKPGQEKSRYGFVHFADRSSTMKAVENTEKCELDGQVIECSLAKPQADQKITGISSSQQAPILPTYPSCMGYGLTPYGALGARYPGASFTQPLLYGRGASPGMAMMPMLMPDGRIGYVLQQPGVQSHLLSPPQRGGGRERNSGGGSSSSGGKHGVDGGRGRSRYKPY